jgi:hypothetical protein
MLRGDLTYKVTAGPDGTHIIHLFSTPGSKFTFGAIANLSNSLNLVGSQVWYTYYDVSGADADECRRINSDVVLTPDQVALDSIDYEFLNGPSKITVRKLFFARAKRALANIRGKFSGNISILDAEKTLDYNMLHSQADKEYEATMQELRDRLTRMSPWEMMARDAEMAESMKTILGSKPLKMITC